MDLGPGTVEIERSHFCPNTIIDSDKNLETFNFYSVEKGSRKVDIGTS